MGKCIVLCFLHLNHRFLTFILFNSLLLSHTFLTAWAKRGGKEAAVRAQKLLDNMHALYDAEGVDDAKPDTISYNVVINAIAKSGAKGAAQEAESLLDKMHALHEAGDPDIKPNVVTYGAVIDAYAKAMDAGAAPRADSILANLIRLYQSDPVANSDLRPNTYVFNVSIMVRRTLFLRISL